MISRETYGTLGDDGNCWPQMAGMVPDLDDEVLLVLVGISKLYWFTIAHTTYKYKYTSIVKMVKA